MDNINEQTNLILFLREKWKVADQKLMAIKILVQSVEKHGGNLVSTQDLLKILYEESN